MKYARTLGLFIVAAASLMALVGSASAATLTSPTGTVWGNGKMIKAVAEAPHTKLDGTIVLTCEKSEVEGEITNPGGKDESSVTTTVEAKITKLTFEKCGNNTITVINPGKLTVHSLGNGNGTLTSDGAEITVLTHNILGTLHCIYGTENTDIGTITGSHNTIGGTATLHIGSAPIPRIDNTPDFCGNDAEWTGNYTVTSPNPLYVD